MTAHPSAIRAPALTACVALLAVAACAHPTLTVRPVPFPAPHVTRSQAFEPERYRSILIVPPEERKVGGADTLIGEQRYNYYLSQAERILLEGGHRVIAQDVVARVERQLSSRQLDTATGATYTRTEKALIMGKETNADALLVINTLNDAWDHDWFVESEEDGSLMRAATVEEAAAVRAARDVCVYEAPARNFKFEAKLIDVATGDVLWIASAALTTAHIIPSEWRVEMSGTGRKCTPARQSFPLDQYLARSAAVSQQIVNLMSSVFGDLARRGGLPSLRPEAPPGATPAAPAGARTLPLPPRPPAATPAPAASVARPSPPDRSPSIPAESLNTAPVAPSSATATAGAPADRAGRP